MEKQQTAMQELEIKVIEWIKFADDRVNFIQKEAYENILKLIKEYKPKERQQIEEAYSSGKKNGFKVSVEGSIPNISPSDYFTEKYGS